MARNGTNKAHGVGPESWTLRLKHQKSVFILHTVPSTPFSAIKADLLEALNEVVPASDNLKSLQPLPKDPELIVFAVPVDKADPSKGWVPLEVPETEVEGEGGSTRTVGGEGALMNSSPEAAGLRDGSQLAFRFLTKREIDSGETESAGALWVVEQPSLEDEGEAGAVTGAEDDE